VSLLWKTGYHGIQHVQNHVKIGAIGGSDLDAAWLQAQFCTESAAAGFQAMWGNLQGVYLTTSEAI
jgi:hypothetical protein